MSEEIFTHCFINGCCCQMFRNTSTASSSACEYCQHSQNQHYLAGIKFAGENNVRWFQPQSTKNCDSLVPGFSSSSSLPAAAISTTPSLITHTTSSSSNNNTDFGQSVLQQSNNLVFGQSYKHNPSNCNNDNTFSTPRPTTSSAERERHAKFTKISAQVAVQPVSDSSKSLPHPLSLPGTLWNGTNNNSSGKRSGKRGRSTKRDVRRGQQQQQCTSLDTLSPSPRVVIKKLSSFPPLRLFFLQRDRLPPKTGYELNELTKNKTYFEKFPYYDADGIPISQSAFETKINEIEDPFLLSLFQIGQSYSFYEGQGRKELPKLMKYSDKSFLKDVEGWKAVASTSKLHPLIITPGYDGSPSFGQLVTNDDRYSY